MPKYLVQASYTTEGIRGLLKDGGSKRRAAAEQAIKSLGGRLEAFYFAFGDTDAFVIADAPDNISAAAVSLAVGASGAVHAKTTVLLTPEEMDQATKKTVSYSPPGR
ncbi:MAG: GYD domain-containing protein [Candidatus Rokubacteria bacterium]|nr:GYD domain-containing protein [Candidatus Rokubacteria bacterium]MBI2553750.1 GYD domain-containing protein [Candidatus Rokubacteria bacterium]